MLRGRKQWKRGSDITNMMYLMDLSGEEEDWHRRSRRRRTLQCVCVEKDTQIFNEGSVKTGLIGQESESGKETRENGERATKPIYH